MSAQKNTVRLTQLLLFTAGSNFDELPMRNTGLDNIVIKRFGIQSIYQTDWLIYKAFIDIAKNNQSPIIKMPLKDFIKQTARENTEKTRNAIYQLSLTLPSIFIIIEEKHSLNTIVLGSMLDHLSFKDDHILFSIKKDMVDFWQKGEWDTNDNLRRTQLRASEIALWIYALSQIIPDKVTPSFKRLIPMSGIKNKRESNFLQSATRAVSTINENTSFKCEIGKNSNSEYVIFFHKKE